MHSGPATSVFGGGGAPATQLRSQPSQQSFSQGVSSQHGGMLSQFSQTSLDDVVPNDQRFGSQERENSAKRMSCLPVSYPRDESQIPISRASNNLMRKWCSTSGQDHKCQIGDELEHRMTLMETSLGRMGMILDSVQNDVVQVNKRTKELSLEVEGLQQKSTAHDDSLHLLVMTYSLKTSNQWNSAPDILLPKVTGCDSSSQMSLPKSAIGTVPANKILPKQTPAISNIKVGACNSVKAEKGTLVDEGFCNTKKHRRVSYVNLDKESRTLVCLDDDLDGDCLFGLLEKETDRYYNISENNMISEAKQETKRILRKARRRKRRHSDTIVID